MSEQPGATRTEADSMGSVQVPAGAYWGAQTQRAVLNFPISQRRFPRRFLAALGAVKAAAARANGDIGELDPDMATAVERAAHEVAEGRLDAEFVVDIFQTGSGTSTNMNANEVIANRAAELLGGAIGSGLVHPNDHVNRGQSSNDVIPTALHVAALDGTDRVLIPALEKLHASLVAKATFAGDAVKLGRTHLQDATPVRFAQVFAGYARQVELGIDRLRDVRPRLGELALGGTAVGTGLNAPAPFAARTIEILARTTGLPLREAADHFEAQGAQDGAVEASAAVRTVAVSLLKIANDIRLLASGPRGGIAELRLPPVAPGSSIMPGKVNPVIAESLIQVSAQVIGNDLTVCTGGQWGFFELNTMLPVMAANLIESIEILGAAAENFARRCVDGIEFDRERGIELLERSLAMVTALAPAIGYDAAAAIAKEGWNSGRTIREICLERRILPEQELDRILDPLRMTGGSEDHS